MKLAALSKKPELVKVELNDEDTLKEFGEALEFWTWDRQPMDVFMRLASLDVKDTSNVIDALRQLVLDEDGKPILTEETSLPARVLIRVITRLVDDLGK